MQEVHGLFSDIDELLAQGKQDIAGWWQEGWHSQIDDETFNSHIVFVLLVFSIFWMWLLREFTKISFFSFKL